MGSKKPRQQSSRRTTLETLEDRQMFSVDSLGALLGGSIEPHGISEQPLELHNVPAPVHHAERDADFWIDHATERDLAELLGDVEQTLSSAHNLTNWKQVRQDYGFTGLGQTVAVIDSGIAYDHWALGGGYGAGHRVVGGWDFTENDANAYDDGPSGSHGTHVAGIVGGDRAGTDDDGVAPGADLVSLRVFNDAGDGYFSWVESALSWVHTNRNSFANPITAVNLSLGTSWNSASIPSWAMLENEFAQLEADGIFVTVSAGNSFTTYNTAGLSYPAASPHVVPVMSVDDNGAFSYFSQRHTRGLAAPGRFITSTVPDYVGNHNGVTDDFASYSGTSMAAPYVAGASVLVREAMEFVGYTNINQWTIYSHLMATADTFYDAATNANYQRLNLGNAIDTLLGADDFGSTAGTAHDLGTLSGNGQVSGLIGKLDDADYFQFTAGVTGTVTFTANTSQQLAAAWTGSGTANGDTYTIDVVAGQTYTLGLGTSGGLGNYDLAYAVEADQAPVTIKTMVGGGVVYSLDSNGWLSVDGVPTWSDTFDFVFAGNTLVRQNMDGTVARSVNGGAWQTLDTNVVKFTVTRGGTVYSLGQDRLLSINGRAVWANTDDFDVAADGTIHWQGGDRLFRRMSDRSWQLVDNGTTMFFARDNGTAYSMGDDNVLHINGRTVWWRTSDFVVTPDQALYWHGTNGLLERLPAGGRWQTVARDVSEFAISHDGSAYALTTGGDVMLNGVAAWSNIADMRIDASGSLELVDGIGGVSRVAGRFYTSKIGGGVQSAGSSTQSLQTAAQTDGAAMNSTMSFYDVMSNRLGGLAVGRGDLSAAADRTGVAVGADQAISLIAYRPSSQVGSSVGAFVGQNNAAGASRSERGVDESFAVYDGLESVERFGSRHLADELVDRLGADPLREQGVDAILVDDLFAEVGDH